MCLLPVLAKVLDTSAFAQCTEQADADGHCAGSLPTQAPPGNEEEDESAVDSFGAWYYGTCSADLACTAAPGPQPPQPPSSASMGTPVLAWHPGFVQHLSAMLTPSAQMDSACSEAPSSTPAASMYAALKAADLQVLSS